MQNPEIVHPLETAEVQNKIGRHGKQELNGINKKQNLESALTKKMQMIDCSALLVMPTIFIIVFVSYFVENTIG